MLLLTVIITIITSNFIDYTDLNHMMFMNTKANRVVALFLCDCGDDDADVRECVGLLSAKHMPSCFMVNWSYCRRGKIRLITPGV